MGQVKGARGPALWAWGHHTHPSLGRKERSASVPHPLQASPLFLHCGDTAGQTLLWPRLHAHSLQVTGPFSPASAPNLRHAPHNRVWPSAPFPPHSPQLLGSGVVSHGSGPLSRLWAHGSRCSSALAPCQHGWPALPQLQLPSTALSPASAAAVPLALPFSAPGSPSSLGGGVPGLLTPSLACCPVHQAHLEHLHHPIGPGDCQSRDPEFS